MTKYISILSGKGGAGKTVTAINFAYSLQKRGYRTVLVDSNPLHGMVGQYLGYPKLSHTLHEALEGNARTLDAVYRHASGIYVMPTNISRESCKPKRSFASIMLDLYGRADFVIMDCPNISTPMGDVLAATDEAIVVADPHEPMHATEHAIRIAEDNYATVVGVLMTKVRSRKHAARSGFGLKRPVINHIPHDKAIISSIGKKHPSTALSPNCPSSRAYGELAMMFS